VGAGLGVVELDAVVEGVVDELAVEGDVGEVVVVDVVVGTGRS
jgi:hypothetical protein